MSHFPLLPCLVLATALVSMNGLAHAGAPPREAIAQESPAAQDAPEQRMPEQGMPEEGMPEEGAVDADSTPGGRQLDSIVVVGTLPGPGLWKVRKGEHVMYILGTQNPLPKRMEWDSRAVERRVAGAERLLLMPRVEFDADVGFFRRLALIPSLLKARRNPDGKTLQQMVPAEQYARWLPLKARYIGRDRDVEEWRPIFAAFELYQKAIEQQGMTQRGVAEDAVERAAKRAKVPITQPEIMLRIADPKKAVREFSQTVLADQECFRLTLDRIEGDLQNMRARANAWAEGDVARLRGLSNYRSQFKACADAFGSAEAARRLGIGNLQARVRETWLAEVDKTLAAHKTSFAVLPVQFLIGEDNALGRLQARGYTIEEP